MPEVHDVGRVFVTSMRYPPTGRWSLFDPEAFVHEIEEPYRIGKGVSLRVPGTRWAAIFGLWMDEGGDEVERLTSALRASDAESAADEIRGW